MEENNTVQNSGSTSEKSDILTVNKGESIKTKDLLVPASIVLAGIFVGAGLYFSGGAPSNGTSENLEIIGGQPEAQSVTDLAVSAGVDREDFLECVQSEEIVALVDEQATNAFDTGGGGTPWSIMIGPGGKKYPINGALPQANIEQAIALAKSEAGQGPGNTEAELALEKMLPLSSSDNIRGSLDAEIIIVEYSDFDCPFCQRFHNTMKAVYEKYDGEVAWVYRHLPLTQLHPNAKAVAVASECVAELGGNEAFWKFADSYLR